MSPICISLWMAVIPTQAQRQPTPSTNYFIVDMARKGVCYVMWCHRNATHNRILTFDIYGSNDDAAFGNGSTTRPDSYAGPLHVSKRPNHPAHRHQQWEKVQIPLCQDRSLSYPSSGMTFGISEFNLGVIR